MDLKSKDSKTNPETKAWEVSLRSDFYRRPSQQARERSSSSLLQHTSTTDGSGKLPSATVRASPSQDITQPAAPSSSRTAQTSGLPELWTRHEGFSDVTPHNVVRPLGSHLPLAVTTDMFSQKYLQSIKHRQSLLVEQKLSSENIPGGSSDVPQALDKKLRVDRNFLETGHRATPFEESALPLESPKPKVLKDSTRKNYKGKKERMAELDTLSAVEDTRVSTEHDEVDVQPKYYAAGSVMENATKKDSIDAIPAASGILNKQLSYAVSCHESIRTKALSDVFGGNDAHSSNTQSYAKSYTRLAHHHGDAWETWGKDKQEYQRQLERGDVEDASSLDLGFRQEISSPTRGRNYNVRETTSALAMFVHHVHNLKKVKKTVKRFQFGTKNELIFGKHIENIEGQFGSGIVSFFIFMRWLFVLNLWLAVLWTVALVIPQSVVFDYSFLDNNFYYINLIDGKNGLEHSAMFYGGYQNSIKSYPVSFVYLICCIFTIFGSLFYVLKGISMAKQANVTSKDTRYVYSGLVFCGWDYSVKESEGINNISMSIVNNFRDLMSDAKLKTKRDRSKKSLAALFLRRFSAWFITCILIGGGCTLIVFLVHSDLPTLLAKMKYEVSPDSLLVVYGPVAVFMIINSMVPMCIYQLPRLEKYASGKTELHVCILRVFVLRIVNIFVLVISLEAKQGEHQGCTGTILGQELYKLVILDTVVQLVILLVSKFAVYYKTGKKKEFSMPASVLVIVYRQALIWLGSLVCPVLPLVGTISTAILFVGNYLMVRVTCKPPSKRWSQARHNLLFLGLTASTLFILIIPATLVITRNDLVQLSLAHTKVNKTSICGPFGNQTMFMAFWDITDSVTNSQPLVNQIFQLFTSATVNLPLFFVLLAFIYFLVMRSSWQRETLDSTLAELYSVSQTLHSSRTKP